MELLINKCTDPAFNLAFEEFFLTKRDGEYFCFWQNRPTVVIGKNQDASMEVDFDFLAKNNIALVRRNTGGGAVFHDLGNVNFSYITPCEKRDFFDFEKFSRPVLSALSSLGVPAEKNGRNDLTVDGMKISGCAQYMHGGRMLHHGTLLYSSDFSYMQGALSVDPRKLKTKGVSSVRSRVTNISSYLRSPLSVSEFIEHLQKHILGYFDNISVYTPTDSELSQIEALADKKYRSDEWTLNKTGNYAYRGDLCLPCGLISAGFTVENGVITDISIKGDFFGRCDISGLCKRLLGTKHDKNELLTVLCACNVEDYISGCDANSLLPLFF